VRSLAKKFSCGCQFLVRLSNTCLKLEKTPYEDVLGALAETIRRFAKNSIFNSKYIETKVVSIDEPSFGLNNIQATSDVICRVLEKAYDFQEPQGKFTCIQLLESTIC